jgi:hypothetical protein
MMIQDLEIHEELARDERSATRGGNSTILPGGCYPEIPPGPHVPTVEELLSKIAERFKSPVIITDNPRAVPLPLYSPESQL